MKEPHSEGVANHADLESCAGAGENAGEALAEALAGRRSSREIRLSGADPVDRRGRPDRPSRYRKRRTNPARSREPVHVRKLPAREPGELGGACREVAARRGKAQAPRLRRRAAGAGGSRDERFEQGRGSVGGESRGKQPRPTSVNANENVQRPRTDRARQRAAVSQGLEGVRQTARRKATGKFTSLLHHLTLELLRGSFSP